MFYSICYDFYILPYFYRDATPAYIMSKLGSTQLPDVNATFDDIGVPVEYTFYVSFPYIHFISNSRCIWLSNPTQNLTPRPPPQHQPINHHPKPNPYRTYPKIVFESLIFFFCYVPILYHVIQRFFDSLIPW